MESKKLPQSSIDELSDIVVNEKLHEWEKLDDCSAPLSIFQRNTCLDLGDEVISRMFPESLIEDKNDNIIQGDVKIETTWQFLDWYTNISNKWLDLGNEKYNEELQVLTEKRDQCSVVLNKIDKVLVQLDQLKTDYKQVSCKTNPLYLVSQKLSVDQSKLSAALEEANNRLFPFQKIENIVKRLESSAIAVTSDAFLGILNDIDKCIEYFQSHDKYKESAIYLVKSRHCLSRALADVKSYIMSVLDTCKTFSSTISLMPVAGFEGSSVDISKGSKFVAQYGRFQNISVRLKPLLNQLETRAEKCIEYENSLEECLRYYVNLRQQVIGPPLRDAISQLVVSHAGHYCSLLRAISTELIHMCQDEDKLYYQFFCKPSQIFSDFVESLCSILYDTLRPLVIQMKHMETLAEFCSILRVGILQEQVLNNLSLQPLGTVVEQLQKDVQERLVFRAHLYFKADILHFKPSSGDLAYPEKLEMMKNIAEEIKVQENASLARYDSRLSLTSIGSCGDSVRSATSRVSKYPILSDSSPADLHGMWYPTIRRTLVCLSRLYRCVEKPVFQGLAQEAIACCCENVNEATQIISRTKSTLDGQLFQIKHLLILREQIAPFQVDFTATEMSIDFNQLKSAAYGLFHREKLFSLTSSNAILELILHGSPLLRENYLDSRKVVDLQLKNTCEAFIWNSANLAIAPIKNYLQQIKNHKTSEKGTSPIKDEDFGKPDHVQDIVRESVKKIKSVIPVLLHKMDLYLANQDTQFILYKPVKNKIVSTFAKMQSIVEENYTEENQLLIGCPTAEQISVLLSSTILSRKLSTACEIPVKDPTVSSSEHKK